MLHRRFTLLILLTLLLSSGLWGQERSRVWAVKTGIAGAFFNNFNLEAEHALGGNKSVYLRGAVGNPVLRTDTFGFDRFWIKAGMRFYWGGDKESEGLSSGFFVAPEVVFMYQFDSDYPLRNAGPRFEHSIGGLATVGYVIPIGERLRLEASVGGGFIATWLNYDYVDDVTLEVIPRNWYYLDHEDRKAFYHSHFSFLGSGALSGTLAIGITL